MVQFWTNKIKTLLAVIMIMGACSGVTVKSAQAATCWCFPYGCPPCCFGAIPQTYIQNAFNQYRQNFIMNSFYRNQFERQGLMPIADDLRGTIAATAMMIGAFLDGYSANAALAQMQSLNAETLRDYQVSDTICKFGTLSRSLAATDLKTSTQQIVLSEIGLSRNLGTSEGIASSGRGRDNQSRLNAFVEYFCDTADNNNGLEALCKPAGGTRDTEFNRDIDFTRTIDAPATLNVELTDTTLSRDEASVIQLGHFLYGHMQDTKRMSPSVMSEKEGGGARYASIRSIIARRSAAQNSYNAIVAMKSSGSGSSKSYMSSVLGHLGMAPGDVNKYMGGYLGTAKAGFDQVASPSYYAQMDVLTKRIYQDPSFYVSLMDTKSNVKRTSATLEGLTLAQDRDVFKSMARSELLLAVLLELESRKQGDTTEAGLNNISER